MLQTVVAGHDNRETGEPLIQNSGGGIFNSSSGDLTLIESTISGNHADRGGAMFNASGGDVSIISSTISGNSANKSGGGIYNDSNGTLSLLHATVADNRADVLDDRGNYGGGGLFNAASAASLILHNSIVADNIRGAATDSQIAGAVNSASSYNLIAACYGSGLSPSQHNLFVTFGDDARLGPLADNGGPTWTHALLGNSLALDAGSNQKATEAGLTLDQRGIDRFRDSGIEAGRTDIGAYEAVATPTTFCGHHRSGRR